jgi:uncharacterized protein (DUF1800 family)
MRPLDPSRWNRQTAAHLLNRAGFGASPSEIDAAARRKPRDLVEELVEYPGRRDIPEPTFLVENKEADFIESFRRPDLPEEERRKRLMEAQRKGREGLLEMRAWWLYLMRHTRHPLQEKLTLFWHGHFATSQEKVKSPTLMYRQNRMLRENSHGNWEGLLVKISQDPAMLVYLDNARSNARQPNENYARELMELFSLGEGNYTEDDIKASARAFTGWSVDRENFSFLKREFMHDDGTKTFMGQTGRFDGTEIIRIILQHREAPRFITRKLWEFFAYAGPEEEIVDDLAGLLKKSAFELKPVLKEMLLSEAFYGQRAYRTQIKSPVQWLLGYLQATEAPLPPGIFCNLCLRTLGQDLFEPPNVKGWDGGPAWITSANLLNRYNIAGQLVKGGASGQKSPFDLPNPGMQARVDQGLRRMPALLDPARVLPSEARVSREAVRDHLFLRMFQDPLREKDRAAFDQALASMPEPKTWGNAEVEDALHHLMSTPQYQLT